MGLLQVLSPFIYNATKQLLATSFKSPDLELPRRMAANPQLYAKVHLHEAVKHLHFSVLMLQDPRPGAAPPHRHHTTALQR